MMVKLTIQQSKELLRSSCEQAIKSLNKLTCLHFEMDPPTREILKSDEEIEFRMRKVLLHVNAIKSWEIDTDVMHVLAPEIRSAIEQIYHVRKKQFLNDEAYFQRERKYDFTESIKSSKRYLDPYIHPSTQTLLLPKELGGLQKRDEVRYYWIMFPSLMILVHEYGNSLKYLSQLLHAEKKTDIEMILEEFGQIAANALPHVQFECNP